MIKIPITKTGAEKLRLELERLKQVERPRIINAIAEARAHGDLKENAEYHAAREQQSFNEAKIRDLEHNLAHAQIVDVATMTNLEQIVFGATVTLVNLDEDIEVCYQIVGECEADIKQHKISITSPLARALIGKRVNDEVEVQAPNGKVLYEITGIAYL